MSWRDTLFVWRGTLVGDGDRLTFEGSWVGATTGPGLPSLSEHEASENVFSVTGRIPGGGIDDLDGKTWTVDGGAYQLDNGDGLECTAPCSASSRRSGGRRSPTPSK